MTTLTIARPLLLIPQPRGARFRGAGLSRPFERCRRLTIRRARDCWRAAVAPPKPTAAPGEGASAATTAPASSVLKRAAASGHSKADELRNQDTSPRPRAK
jgi:hypothetical protein